MSEDDSRNGRPRSALVLAESTIQLLYGPEGLDRIRRGSQLVTVCEPTAMTVNPACLHRIEVLFAGWGCPPMTAAVLDAAPLLRAIFFAGGSIRSWISDAVWERDITVVSAFSANAVPVAEYSLATIILSLKRAWECVGRHKLSGSYPLPPATPAGALGSTVGLVSLGAIGRLVREKLRPLEVRVLAYDPFVSKETAAALEVEMVGLEELFQQSDVVSIHAPLLPETTGMITGRHLASMRPGATVINTARGRLLDEPSVAQALRARPDVTAVLDVMADEPPPADHPLLPLANVFVTPHIAGSQGLECRRMGRLVIDQYEKWRRGDPLEWRINRETARLLA